MDQVSGAPGRDPGCGGRHPGGRAESWWFEPRASVVRNARWLAEAALAGWGLPADDTEPIVYVINELVTNAVEHAGTRFHLSLRLDDDAVLVAVRDRSPLPPRSRPFDVDAARGRGLQLVGMLAERWWWTAEADGKTVSARVTPHRWR